MKCSTRDLPIIAARMASSTTQQSSDINQWGATTVASTMYLANLAGIATFVTGGTGGVHRDGENTMDVSADLHELSRTPVVVVSAGIKSILDIQRTLEVLETLSVPTVSYQTDMFPAFFSPSSGVVSPNRVDNSQDVARMYWSARDLNLQSGMLVAVPNEEPTGALVEEAIQLALTEVTKLGVVGREVTPYVLQAVAEKTGGSSLTSNIALVKHNASVGADIAVEIAAEAKYRSEHDGQSHLFSTGSPSSAGSGVHSKESPSIPIEPGKVIVMGGAVVDLVAKPIEGSQLILGTSNPGTCTESDGGVGRNIAEVLGRLGAYPSFYSAVGGIDDFGKSLVQRLEMECGVYRANDTVAVIDSARTATYLAVLNDHGELHAAIADMNVLDGIPIPSEEKMALATILVVDANPPVETLIQVAERASKYGVGILVEPTSVPKAERVANSLEFLKHVAYATPNMDELMVMASAICNASTADRDHTGVVYHTQLKTESALFESVKKACSIVLSKMNWRREAGAHLIVTLGERGVMHAFCSSSAKKMSPKPHEAVEYEITYSLYPVPTKVKVKNCTGAGDTLCGAFVHALIQGKNESEAIHIGMNAALKSLLCENRTISPDLAS